MFNRVLPDWPVEPPRVRWGLREAFICLVVAQFGALLWATAVVVVSGESTTRSRPIAFLVVSNLALWLAYFLGPLIVSRRLGQGPRIDFDIGIDLGEAAVAASAGVILQLAVLPLAYWPITRVVDADPGRAAQDLVDRVNSPFDVVLLAVAVVLIAPVVEELFYRGMLLPAVTSATGVVVGIVGSALIFALVHQDLILVPGLTLFGVLVGWLTATTGRIGPAIVAHMAFNATTVIKLLTEI